MSFFISFIGFALPFANAANEQLKTSVSDEQAFLEVVRANSNQLTFDQNPKWKKINDKTWTRIVEDFSYAGKKEKAYFVIQTNPSNQEEFFLIAYRNINGSWVPRYGTGKSGGPIAIGAFNSKGFRTLYINPINVEGILNNSSLFAAVDDRQDRIDAIKMTAQEKLIPKDIKQRGLIEQILRVPQDSKEKSLYKLNKIEERYVDLDSLNKEVAKNILRGAIQGQIAFNELFDGIYTKEQWQRFFSSSDNGLKDSTLQSSNYKKILTEELNSSPFIHAPVSVDVSKEINAFNKNIKTIRDVCKNLKIENEKRLATEAPRTWTYSASNADKLKEDYQNQLERTEITSEQQQLADAGAKESLDEITKYSPLATLWPAESFEVAVGHFTPKSCIDDGDKVPLYEINVTDTTWAMKTVKEKFIKVINNSVKVIDSKSGEYGNDRFKRTIRSSPISIQVAISDRKVVNEVAFLVQDIAEIYSQDQFDVYVDQTIAAVGFITGVAAAIISDGAGGVITKSIMVLTDAATTYRGINQWYDAKILDSAIRGSMITGQIDQDKGQEALRKNKESGNSGLNNATFTIAATGAGYAIGKIVTPAEREIPKTKPTKKIPEPYIPNTRVLVEPTTPEQIADFNQTITKAEEVLGRELSPNGKSLVWNAHLYGQGGEGTIPGTTAGIGNYKSEVNTVKLKIASEDGHGEVTLQEAKKLADANVLGYDPANIVQLPQPMDPSMIKAQQLIEQKKQPVQKKMIYESVKDGEMDVVQIKGVPPNANLYSHGNNEIFRHYFSSSGTVSEVVGTGTLKSGTNTYVIIHPGVRKEIYEDITGMFITKPGFSPRQVGLDNVKNMDYVDFTIGPEVGLIQLEPGIFVVPGQPTIPQWIKNDFIKFKESGATEYPKGLEETFKRMESWPNLDGSAVNIKVKEYTQNGEHHTLP